LQRQRQQTSDAAEEFLRRHYPSASQASHGQEEEVSELDRRLRMIEQDSRILEAEGHHSRSPTPPVTLERHPIFRRVSPDRESTSPPPRATNSVLPLNLSKETSSQLDDDQLHSSVDDQEASPPSPIRHASAMSFRDSVTPPMAFKASPPSSHASSPPPLGTSKFRDNR
jgi:hypothetical protein